MQEGDQKTVAYLVPTAEETAEAERVCWLSGSLLRPVIG
jgi:hypothetical protein